VIQVERLNDEFYLQMYECLPNRPVVGTVGQAFSWCSYIAQLLVRVLNVLVVGMWLRVQYAGLKLTVVTVLPDPGVAPGQSSCEGEVSSELQLCKRGATQEACTP